MTSRHLNAALIPLRGSSKGIVEKYIKPMVGKPVFAWVIEAAVEALDIIKCIFQPTARRLHTLRRVMRKLNKPYQKYCYKNKQTDMLIKIIKQGSCRLTR